MFKARNGFSFHRGPGGGLDVVVRYAKAQNGEIFESVSLDKKEFYKLLDYLGIAQAGPPEAEQPDPEPPPSETVSTEPTPAKPADLLPIPIDEITPLVTMERDPESDEDDRED